MPSNNKNIIGDLRGKFDPHYKLASNVEGIQKGLGIEVAKIHKTLSKSFVTQRKTLTRVIALEKRVSGNETRISNLADVAIKIGEEQAERKKAIAEAAVVAAEELGEEIPEGLDDVLDDIRGDDAEVGSTKTKTKPKTKKKPKAKKKPVAKKRGKKSFSKVKDKVKAEKFFNLAQEVRAQGTLGGKTLTPEQRKAGFKAAKGGEDSVNWKEFIDSVEETKSASDEGITPNTKMLPGSSDMGQGVLEGISADVKSILGVIDSRTEAEEDASDELKQEDEKDKRKKKEEDKEKNAKKGGMKIPGFIQTAAKPITNIWSNIVKTFGILLAGWGVDKIFKWLGDPKNKKSVEELKEFITVAVPAVLKGILALTALNIGITVAKFAIMLAKGAATMLKGLWNLAGTIKNMIMKNPKLALALGITAIAAWGINKAMNKDKEEEKGDESSEDLKLFKSEGGGEDKKVKMNGGGVVPHLKMAGGGLVFGYNEGAEVVDNSTPMTTEDIVAATGPSLMMFMEQQNAAVDENPEAWGGIKLKLDRDGKMPNFGEFIMNQGEAAFNQGLEMLQNNESVEPEVKEALLKKALFIRKQTLDNPNFKGDVAFDINKDIPGTAANRLFLKAQADTSSIAAKGGISAFDRALLMNRRGMSGGGLVRAFNKGGTVPGSGNKDTVPAMLTPGEFVMSKGAVEKYGTSTLASMNAMGGGNNTPEIVGTIKGFNQGGIVGRIKGVAKSIRNTAKKLINSVPDGGTPNVSIVPVPSGGSGGASGGGGGGSDDNDVALFSPINHEDMQTLIVKNMYSILD